jgi:radical SAM superfamily enzyme YgiQ (UPF0313 family)
MADSRQKVLLAQLPIPAVGAQPIRGNIPLAAGCLSLSARRRGLDRAAAVDILPPAEVNTLGDRGLVDAIADRRPRVVAFTCYLWNIQRTLWLAERLKQADPSVRIVLGGPEIALDNRWVLEHPSVDYAIVGEGEPTWCDLLAATVSGGATTTDALPAIPGLWSRRAPDSFFHRKPLADLDAVFSPYLEGILDVADERLMMLETVRGCLYRCKYCYYRKRYDRVHFLSPENTQAALRHAAQRGAKEVVFLDPTLNQRPDFKEFLRLVASHNPGRQFACFGELRAEGIDAEAARLLKEANFSELEIGLQSIAPEAQRLMDRRVDLPAMERGLGALRDEGIGVRIDLMLGLPGDTVDSIRRGIDYVHSSRLYSAVQVFNLSVLPGTAFRNEAAALGLEYQPRPPYYVLRTPTLALEDMYTLMEEAQEAFGIEFDPLPAPALEVPGDVPGPAGAGCIDLDRGVSRLPPPNRRAGAFTLWLQSADFDRRRDAAAAAVGEAIDATPHATFEIVLEPAGNPVHLTERTLERCLNACYASTGYLDMFYSLHPNRLLGAKRLVVVLPADRRAALGHVWIDMLGRYAAVVWRGGPVDPADLAAHEHTAP